MPTDKKGRDFTNLGSDLMAESQAASGESTKPYKLTFDLEDDLVQGFERELHHRPKATKKLVLNAAVKFYLENHPKASQRAQMPIPEQSDEDE